MIADFPVSRFARGIIRQLGLPTGARILVVGNRPGDVVQRLRRAGRQAYGLFDGPAGDRADGGDVPAIQPATLHQSLPFLAQSFDAVVVAETGDYAGSLSSPEACTATANLLAALKPDGTFLYCGTTDAAAMKRHLGQFPGKRQQIALGSGGIIGGLLRLAGLIRPGLPTLKVTIPHESITRLEWHRLARKAVEHLSRATDSDSGREVEAATETSAA